MTHSHDDLEPLLQPGPGVPLSAERRAELLRASTRVLHRGVFLRQLSMAAAAAIVFLVGGIAGWVLKPPPAREVVTVMIPTEPKEETPPLTPRGLSARELELKAELSDDPAEVARLYREAGDKYLTDEKDYAQAARCYRLHLNAADPNTRRVAVSDSWLLMSMKSNVQ